MQNINKLRRINLGLVKRALFTIQVRLNVRYLHCGKGKGIVSVRFPLRITVVY